MLLASSCAQDEQTLTYTQTEQPSIIYITDHSIIPYRFYIEYSEHALFYYNYPKGFVYLSPEQIENGLMHVYPGELWTFSNPFQPQEGDDSDNCTLLRFSGAPLSVLTRTRLEIRVQPPGCGSYTSAGDKFEAMYAQVEAISDSIIRDSIEVSGITAQYMESMQQRPDILISYGDFTRKDSKISQRTAIFENNGSVWEISLYWHYYDDEPPEVKEYYDLVIESFRIVEFPNAW